MLQQRVYSYAAGYASEVTAAAASDQPLTAPFLTVPSRYEWNGAHYDMTAEGLYRLWASAPGYEAAGFRLVYAGTGNARALMSGIAGITLHGVEHEALSHDQKLDAARAGPLAMRCGHIDMFARTILAAVGVPARSVSLVSVTDTSNFDVGHVLTEVVTGGKWVAYDTSFDRAFRDLNGNLLTAGQLPAAIAAGAYTDDALIRSGCAYWPSTSLTAHHIASIVEKPGGLAQWTQRVMQAVGIWTPENICYFKMPAGTSAAKKQWLLSLSADYRVIDNHGVWNQTFYGG